MLDSLIALHLRPLVSDFCVIGSQVIYENEALDSRIILQRDFDIHLYPAENKALPVQIGEVSGFLIDMENLIASFKEKHHEYIYDFEYFGEEIGNLYVDIFEEIDFDSTDYRFVYVATNIAIEPLYDTEEVHQAVFKLLSLSIGRMLKVDLSHVWRLDTTRTEEAKFRAVEN